MALSARASVSGLTLGAGLSLAQVQDVLADVVQQLPEEKTQTLCALLKQLRTLAGSQIRNMAVCVWGLRARGVVPKESFCSLKQAERTSLQIKFSLNSCFSTVLLKLQNSGENSLF